jgi:hypothetical protein
MQKQICSKAEVMVQSIGKVEKARYGLVVRGSERRSTADLLEEERAWQP